MATLSPLKQRVPSIGRDPSPIAVLANRNSIDAGERDIRVDDYLNDKLQISADFEDLDALIASVETQRIQLQDQLQDATTKLENARTEAAAHAESLVQRTETFRSQQEAIDKRLMIVTASNAPDDAVQRFRGPMEKLRRLELANSYVELLQEVDRLTSEAREHLPNEPKAALKPYALLKQLSVSLGSLQGPAEGAGVHVVTYVDKMVNSLWEEMQQIMTDEFEMVLKRIDWPSSVDDQALTREWSESFQKLLDLQTPELNSSSGPVILLPMRVMAKPFIKQFRYHFMGTRPTNSSFTPDYFFQWTLDTISKWEDFFYENVGPVLSAHFRGSELATNSLYINPVVAFITALLPVLREKIDSHILSVAQDPQHLSEFMLLLMKFDDNVRKQFQYDGGDSQNGWKGLTWEVLDVWFDRWLEVEKDFALSRYEDIIAAPDSGRIDYDSTIAGKTKPTYGAAKITDLLGTVTKLYQRLRKFSSKLRFLIDVQLTILDQYHNRLKDSLDAYQSITSTLGRTLHGVTKEQQTALEGIGGLESLCKVYGSADHIIVTLQDWTSELFFVNLWNELQERAKKTDKQDNLAGPMSFADVKSSTSASVGSDEDGGLFDETITAFKKRRNHAHNLLVEAIKYAFPTSLRSYINKPQWLTIADDAEADPSLLSVTAELDQPLQTLKINMAFLHKALATAPFRRIWREALDTLQDLLWTDILMRERFTTLGAAQFMRDLAALWAVVDEYIPNGTASALGMPKLREGAELLNLPVTGREGVMSVNEAYERVFSDNAEAKLVLEELGLTTLTHFDARAVLQRRVEASDD